MAASARNCVRSDANSTCTFAEASLAYFPPRPIRQKSMILRLECPSGALLLSNDKGARILGFEALGVFRVSWSCLAVLRTPESRRFRDDYRVWRLLCALP